MHASPDADLIEARVAEQQLAPAGYPKTEIWGFEGQVPGPEIRVRQGERVVRRFSNRLPQSSSIHWHGLRLGNSMDGVSGLTQDAVMTGRTFDYDFVAPDAGTYWFHSHTQSVEQVARGLYGALIVDEPEAPDVDQDVTLVLDDWLLDTTSAQIDPDFASPHDRSHAGRRGNLATTNGTYGFSASVKTNERLRLRLINAANARIWGEWRRLGTTNVGCQSRNRKLGLNVALFVIDPHQVCSFAAGSQNIDKKVDPLTRSQQETF